MSTVSELIDQVCRHAGVDSSTGTDDRYEAIRCVDRAHRRVLAEAHGNKLTSTATILSGASSVLFTAISIDRVYRAEDGIELDAVPAGEIQRRLVSAPSSVTAYTFDPLTGVLQVDAVAGSAGTDLLVAYSGRPAALVEGGAESTILIDPLFHEDLIGVLGTVYMLEGVEGQEERAAIHRRNAGDTLQLYKESLVRARGERVASDHAGRWITPNVAQVR